MNHGPLVFLAAFFALAASWCGFVLAPQVQVGRLQQTNTLVTAVSYPVARPGLARQGAEVYRANGCAYCHSQQLEQTGTSFEVALIKSGTNQAALISALLELEPRLRAIATMTDTQALHHLPAAAKAAAQEGATQLLAGLPKVIRREETRAAADAVVKALSIGGAEAQIWIEPAGPDIARGWGKRRTVAEDFLFDYPVMLGSQRIGPDLSNVGARKPDANWQLRHLYAPRSEVKGSTMPAYPFLFEKRRIGQTPSPEALALPAKFAAPAGYELVPRPEARALVAYLLSLRADAPLFDAPLTPPPSAAPASATNSPPRQAAALSAALAESSR